MLDQNDLQQIRTIVKEAVGQEVQPTTHELMGAILHVETRMDAKVDALNCKMDRRCDEILSALNEYATVTDRRIARLEAFHA